MICHLCAQPAIGQCRACWRFYCAAHGADFCETCESRPLTSASRSAGVWQSLAAMRAEGATGEHIAEQVARLNMNATNLHSVVPIVRRVPWRRGELTLISLERYDDGSILRYQIVTDSVPTPTAFPLSTLFASDVMDVPVRVEDDLKTRYYCMPGGGGGDDRSWRGEIRVTPAIPRGAKRLTVSLRTPLTNLDARASSGSTLQIALDLEP